MYVERYKAYIECIHDVHDINLMYAGWHCHTYSMLESLLVFTAYVSGVTIQRSSVWYDSDKLTLHFVTVPELISELNQVCVNAVYDVS